MQDAARPIRVLAFMEATVVTGPAKNLIEFAHQGEHPPDGLSPVDLTVATYVRGTSENAFVAGIRQAGLKLEIVRERHALDPAVIPQLRKIAARVQPDILQTHNSKSHFLARWTGLHRLWPWVAFHHGYTAKNFKDKIYNQVDRWSLRAARHVVTVCKPFAQDLQGRGVSGDRITVQHNSVKPFGPAPPEEAERLRAELGIPDDALVVVTAGRFSREKGHADLIRALAALRSEPPVPPFRVVIVGDGPERGPIERLCSQLGVADQVILPGYRPGLRPFYSLAKVAALPSHSEGSPNALLEAMAAGLAVVATKVGGVPEIATNEDDALLVDARHPQQMAAALARLLRDAELRNRLGSCARGVTSQYTPEAHYRGIIEVYRRVLASEQRS